MKNGKYENEIEIQELEIIFDKDLNNAQKIELDNWVSGCKEQSAEQARENIEPMGGII